MSVESNVVEVQEMNYPGTIPVHKHDTGQDYLNGLEIVGWSASLPDRCVLKALDMTI